MPLTFDMKIAYGEMVIRRTDREGKSHNYTIKIVGGNCLALWIQETKTEYNLFFFLCDKKHGLRVIEGSGDNTLLGKWKEEVVKIKLNMYYKNCSQLLDLFMKSGYEVLCYYKEP